MTIKSTNEKDVRKMENRLANTIHIKQKLYSNNLNEYSF